MSEMIDVWKVGIEGTETTYYEHDINIIVDMLKDCDIGEGYIITKHKMDKEKYEALPEFIGF